MKSAEATAREIVREYQNLCAAHGYTIAHTEGLVHKIADALGKLERLVYVPGQWRCPKCEFRLTQSNLYAATGTVGPRDEPGDKCPNCDGPLWRVSAMDDRHEAFKCANQMFDQVQALKEALAPLARLELPKERQGNTGFYSIRHSDIERARKAASA